MKRFLAAIVILLTVPAAAAGAATPLGDTSTAPSSGASGPVLGVGVADGGGKTYVVPSDGVLTSVKAVAYTGSGTATGRFVAVRRTSGSNVTVVGGTDLPLTATPPASASARIPVKAGDLIGMWVPSGASLAGAPASGGAIAPAPLSSAPTDGSTVALGEPATGVNLLISAALEADADNDGYGDETQDSCPADPAIHAGACVADLAISAAASPAAVPTGSLTTVTATITNKATSPASGAAVALSLPAGVDLVAAFAANDCSGVTCSLGDIPAGQTRKVLLVVRPTSPGTPSIGFAASSSGPEATPGDNLATAALTVTAPAASLPPFRLCTVPKLKGKTKGKAKAALKKADCKAGGVRGRKGKVRTQTIPAGTKVLAGTKVGFRVRRQLSRPKAS